MVRRTRMKRIPKSAPFYGGAKAGFEEGDLVVLPNMLGGAIYEGVVIGRGKDEYGEHQKIKIIHSHSDMHKSGDVVKARLMDLSSLQRFGTMPKSEVKGLTPEKIKRLSSSFA